ATVPRAAEPGRRPAQQADRARTRACREHRQGARHRHPEEAGLLQPHAGGSAGQGAGAGRRGL
ncbi:hypothetical protein XPN_1675, partial [Xanthomonas arboricola pv. pruni MAFF 301427]